MKSPKDISSALRRIAAKIDNSKKPDKNLVVQAIKNVLAAINPSNIDKVNQLLYGTTKPFLKEDAGSQLFWTSFRDLNIVDWIPGMNPQPVFDKTGELFEVIKKEHKVPDWMDPVQEAKRNYNDYKKHYEAEHIEKLKKAGLWTLNLKPSLERYARLKGHVRAFQTLENSSRLYTQFLENGISKQKLDDFLAGRRGRKSSNAKPKKSPKLIRSFLEMGGYIAGGAALKAFMKKDFPGDVDIFFNSYVDWVKATLAAYEDSSIDICLYVKEPCEAFDLGIATISCNMSGFSVSKSCSDALKTNISDIFLENIIHPVATLGRIAKYGERYQVLFRKEQVKNLCLEHEVKDKEIISIAMQYCI